MIADKAGKTYWDHNWDNRSLPEAIDPHAKGINHFVDRKFHEFFRATFSGMRTSEMRILEIGCASSAWLPYFAKEFGFKISGVDYSEQGCALARQILAEQGVEGDVVCCDFFYPPESLLGAVDVVFSFGVAEHFEYTAGCLKAFSQFLKPGGLVITIIPNMVGLLGYFQKVVNRRVFDIHVLLDDRALAANHIPSLKVLSCNYFLFMNWNVINWEGQMSCRLGGRLQSWVSKGFWILENLSPVSFKPNRLSSPYINCVAQKPCG